MSNVKLAIRVRPFTEREQRSEKDRIPVLNVVDKHTVTITNMKVSASGAGDSRERTRRYYADYTFDSSCSPNHPAYASQEQVFESIGRQVLASISHGHSACVMAYGQSATGKTHTMAGSEAQPGLVPRLCRALAPLAPAHVTVSFLEIYNERVHDLLVGEAAPTCHSLPRRRGNARKDLRVREHPTKGPYVQNLRRVAVHDVETLLALVSEGTRRRRTAATRRNNTSSRSHALLELATHNATLHLADLAGSEKASWEGCGDGRQKEGANINKSLVALSNVISALVSCGSGRGRFVPYRDSALTWLLRDCFTGGACTFIIATVSPSFACYGESASTLRWAERARQLPTPKTIKLGSSATSKAVLQAQFNQLLSELSRNYITYTPETGKISYDDHHWNLQSNRNSSNALTSEANIGNIMNILRPKPDAYSESAASSVASESSDVINTIDKNSKMVDEINKEVDKLFTPTLERTSSSTDLKVVAPLRHKRRQYKSQEIPQLDETSVTSPDSTVSLLSPNSAHVKEQNQKAKTPNITILHDNQRANIVATVTDRLYTKLKKKDEAAISKVETVVDKKIMEPLSELRICTNARQRLIELSQKAIKHKRRIGIPAFTQTRKTVMRVKDQATDVQTDLESYIVKNQNPNSYAFHRDVATETVPMTPRCKEVAVGSKSGTLNFSDSSTSTENKTTACKNSYMMTDRLVKYERHTQTPVLPPPRRKKRALNMSKYINNNVHSPEENIAPVISINISQTYSADSETQSSDDNVHNFDDFIRPTLDLTTPDLLTDHCEVNAIENIENQQEICIEVNTLQTNNGDGTSNSIGAVSIESANEIEEFPDTDDYSLPRVSINEIKPNQTEIKNIILGRNENMYPYNIILSPPKVRDTKRIVTFKDIDAAYANNVASQTDWGSDNYTAAIEMKDVLGLASNVHVTIGETDKDVNETIYSDTTDSSKVDTDSFIWKDGNDANKSLGSLRRTNYVPVYKTNSTRPKNMSSQFYREFLRLDNDGTAQKHSLTERLGYNDSSSDSTEVIRSYRGRPKSTSGEYLSKQNKKDMFKDLDRKIAESCNDLERTAYNYEYYLHNYRSSKRGDRKYTSRSPSAHLQHLVSLRREVVKAEIDTTD